MENKWSKWFHYKTNISEALSSYCPDLEEKKTKING